ncbi:hypothetical protein RRG08_048092 [Elysia crispata]|uniref:Uncharacterized protein n=1 Tax=Elysia crispata TaxID=231223 RepID=A0AAE1E997_9GAST|nr:hypothetical protein RRG08_048092 [Elysia crispata]
MLRRFESQNRFYPAMIEMSTTPVNLAMIEMSATSVNSAMIEMSATPFNPAWIEMSATSVSSDMIEMSATSVSDLLAVQCVCHDCPLYRSTSFTGPPCVALWWS